jgi:hypothetical protein
MKYVGMCTFNLSNLHMTDGGRSLIIGLDVKCMISLLVVKH